jgi:prepilin-type N-terminal cleavage/methylation domain-containing protein
VAQRRQNGQIGRRQGFTLLEMLTVIVIIGLLLALGVPSVLQMQKAAMRKASLVIVTQIDGACRIYSNDYRGHFPPSADAAWGLKGRFLVCQLLTGIAPASETKDRVDGWGYKLASNKNVLPYVNVDRIPIAKGAGNSGVFRDAFENDVYYYCQTDDWYNARVNNAATPAAAPFTVADNNDGGPTDINKYTWKSTASPTLYLTTDFVLCTKGADGLWGTKSYKTGTVYENFCEISETDDITNFLPE